MPLETRLVCQCLATPLDVVAEQVPAHARESPTINLYRRNPSQIETTPQVMCVEYFGPDFAESNSAASHIISGRSSFSMKGTKSNFAVTDRFL